MLLVSSFAVCVQFFKVSLSENDNHVCAKLIDCFEIHKIVNLLIVDVTMLK